MPKHQDSTTVIMSLTSVYKTKVKALRSCFVLIFIYLLFPASVIAKNLDNEQYTSRPAREIVWSFESNLLNFNMTLPDASKLQGSAGSFTAGYGRTRKNAWFITRLHVISGPWGSARDGKFDSDYSGTMFDIEYGTAFPRLQLRSGSSPILSIAGGYLDMSGRNIGGNKKAQYDLKASNSDGLEQDFKTSLGELTVTPSIGWSWTRPSRPTGNEEELLQTRVESSSIKLGAIVPLYSRARVSVNKKPEAIGSNEELQRITRTGAVRGYALVSSMTIWLGI